MEDIVRLKDVEKSYGNQPVLRAVSLSVARGEFLAIVGTSGSGKSTLLNIIGGLDSEYRGEVRVLGSLLSGLDDKALSRFRSQHVGFIFQSFNLLDHLTVLENVEVPSYFSARERSATRARELLGKVGLADRAADYPGNLSGGQKQRVAIARALYNAPDLLLCDEPTGNLDSETGRQIIELFSKLNADGLTLIIVTHEERVSAAARRVMRIEDGRMGKEAEAPAAAAAATPKDATA